MTSETQTTDLGERILQLVQECWGEHGKPLLLSQLGSQDEGQIAKRAKEEAEGLGAYIKNRLATKVRIIRHTTKFTIVGAIPFEAGVPDENVDELLEKAIAQPGETISRFHPALWAAFRKPLGANLRRYISAQLPLHFKDVSEEIQSGYAQIEPEYIVDANADAATVQRSISKWLAEQKDIDVAALKATKRIARLPSDDLLGRLLLALGTEDLKRMSIPLDIIKKLRSQSL